MKIKSADFEISAPDLRSCPRNSKPEFAFIGRSNVGKSSLVNMLTGKAGLAKVSATPGKTRLLNFFRINDAWFLIDLPGYGYAKVAKTQSADFSAAVASYLEKRDGLALTFVLIDSMLPPQNIDIQFLRWMHESNLPHALLFTKTDRQSPTATRKAIEAFSAVLDEVNIPLPTVITCSSKTKLGRTEVLKLISDLIATPSRKKRNANADTAAEAAQATPAEEAPTPPETAEEDTAEPEEIHAPLPPKKRVWKP